MGGYSSIPLEPPQNPLESYGKAVQLKSLMQQQQYQQQAQPLELQAKQQEVQQNQIALDDQKKWQQAMQDANGDPDKTLQLATKYGVSPKTLLGIQNSTLDYKTKLIGYSDAQRKVVLANNDAMQGAHEAVDKAPPEQKPQIYQQQVAGLKQLGIDVSQMPPQYPGDEAFQSIGPALKLHSQIAEEAFKQAETSKNTAQAEKDTAEAAKARMEVAAGGTGALADSRYRNVLMKRSQGQPVTADDAAFVKAYEKQKTLVPTTNINLQAGLLNDQAKQMAAQLYEQTGQLPAGMRSPAMSAGILNKAATGPGGVPNIAENKANYAADAASLKHLQTNFDQVSAFENTAGKNLDVFLKQAQKVVDTGIPLINTPVRLISKQMGGENMAAFDAARTTALTEISKVLNSSNASGVLSDSARHEVEGLIGPNATLKQIVSAANILKQDMANRHQAYQDQLNEIKGRSGGKPAAMAAQPAQAGQTKQSGGDFWSQFPEHK